jgi:hypothetical protein
VAVKFDFGEFLIIHKFQVSGFRCQVSVT